MGTSPPGWSRNRSWLVCDSQHSSLLLLRHRYQVQAPSRGCALLVAAAPASPRHRFGRNLRQRNFRRKEVLSCSSIVVPLHHSSHTRMRRSTDCRSSSFSRSLPSCLSNAASRLLSLEPMAARTRRQSSVSTFLALSSHVAPWVAFAVEKVFRRPVVSARACLCRLLGQRINPSWWVRVVLHRPPLCDLEPRLPAPGPSRKLLFPAEGVESQRAKPVLAR